MNKYWSKRLMVLSWGRGAYRDLDWCCGADSQNQRLKSMLSKLITLELKLSGRSNTHHVMSLKYVGVYVWPWVLSLEGSLLPPSPLLLTGDPSNYKSPIHIFLCNYIYYFSTLHQVLNLSEFNFKKQVIRVSISC